MAATHIRIRIGASLDNTVDSAFDSMRRKAQRAGQNVARELSRGVSAGSTGGVGRHPVERQALVAVRAHAQAMRMIERNERQRATVAERQAKRTEQTEHRLFMERLRTSQRLAREAERLERQKTRTTEREANRRARAEMAAERAAARRIAGIRARTMDRFVTRTSHRASRFFWPNAPVTQTMKRVGMDVLRGAGVETNLAGIVGNVVEADKLARSVSIQAYQQGAQGPAGQRVAPGILKREAGGIAEGFAMERTEVLRGLKSFVDMRGNLQGARDLMADMAMLAKSQSANFEEVMHTAAKIDSALASQKEYAGDTAKTYATIRSIMRGVVYQGKIGSVTIEQMAKQIPKLSGIAAQFGGDAGRNIMMLTTATQLAERGPAKNPATAATYVQSLALALPKRAAMIEKFTGKSIFDAGGKMRGLDKIIEEMLWATQTPVKAKDRATGRIIEKTQVQQLQQMLPNKRSFLALQEFLNVFQGSGAGKAGLEAVREEFRRNFSALSDRQMTDDLKVQLDSTASKAARFNERLTDLTERALVRVVPALEQLEEPALKVAEAFSGVFKWAAENPGQAIVVALAGATTRAAIESSFRAAIEASIYRGTGAIVTASAPAATGLTTVGTQAGFASAGLARVAATTGVFLAATAAIYVALDQAGKLSKELKKLQGDLGKGDKDTPPEDPDSPVAKARAKARGKYADAAERMERSGASVLGGAVMAGPGGGGFAGAAFLRAQGEIEGMRAARKAVGEGKTASTRQYRAFADRRLFNAPLEDVAAAADPRKAKEASNQEVVAKLDQLNKTLANGVRVTNPEDFKTPAPGPGVDNSSRSMQ